MPHNDERLMGIIDNTDVVFCNQGYDFTFMPNSLERKIVSIEAKDGFIYGSTYNRRKAAISILKDELDLLGASQHGVPMYIESELPASDIDLSRFRRLLFSGGILNRLLHHNEFEDQIVDDISVANRILYKETYSFATDSFNCTITIGQFPLTKLILILCSTKKKPMLVLTSTRINLLKAYMITTINSICFCRL